VRRYPLPLLPNTPIHHRSIVYHPHRPTTLSRTTQLPTSRRIAGILTSPTVQTTPPPWTLRLWTPRQSLNCSRNSNNNNTNWINSPSPSSALLSPEGIPRTHTLSVSTPAPHLIKAMFPNLIRPLHTQLPTDSPTHRTSWMNHSWTFLPDVPPHQPNPGSPPQTNADIKPTLSRTPPRPHTPPTRPVT
jgi:hypothetical protein